MRQPPSETQRMRNLTKLIGAVSDLPTLPHMLVQLNQLLADPNVSANQIGRLISHDPSLTARILRIVNSAFYGFVARINTITHAIVILGNRNTRQIVLSNFAFEAFRGQPSKTAYDRTEFWKHAIGCASACKAIVLRMGSKKWEDAFIMGLLHDIGKIVIDSCLHEEFLEMLTIIETQDVPMREAEFAVLGVDHCDIGRHLLKRWALTADVISAVAYHHQPAEAGDYLLQASIVHLADILVRAMMYGSGGDWIIPAIDSTAWERLKFSPADLGPLLQSAREETEKAQVFLDIAR